jgi:ribosomal protein L11
MIRLWTFWFCTLLVSSGLANDAVMLKCDPQVLHGLPGEPLRVELTVETERATAIQLRIPAVSNLVLRTVEKVPIQRTATGRFVQKRIIIWQGIEAGSTTLTNLTVVFQGLENSDPKAPTLGKNQQALTQSVPDIGITVDAVEPAAPPAKGEAK